MNTVNDDPAFLITFEMVDAADKRRLARSRWSAQNDFLARADRQVDVRQGFEVAVPFFYAFHGNHGLRGTVGRSLHVHSSDAFADLLSLRRTRPLQRFLASAEAVASSIFHRPFRVRRWL